MAILKLNNPSRVIYQWKMCYYYTRLESNLNTINHNALHKETYCRHCDDGILDWCVQIPEKEEIDK